LYNLLTNFIFLPTFQTFGVYFFLMVQAFFDIFIFLTRLRLARPEAGREMFSLSFQDPSPEMKGKPFYMGPTEIGKITVPRLVPPLSPSVGTGKNARNSRYGKVAVIAAWRQVLTRSLPQVGLHCGVSASP
jgi:hypothetical protein